MTIQAKRYVALVHFRTLIRMGQRHCCATPRTPANDNQEG